MATYQAVIEFEANNLQQAIDAFYGTYGGYLQDGEVSFQEKGE